LSGALPPAPPPLRWMRCARLGLHLLWGMTTVACAYPFLNDAVRLWLKRRWSRQLLDILGIRLAGHPRGMARGREEALAPGSLFIANHVSWLDIFALNAVRPMAFVAKSEVRGWPLAGWLAANTDTLFLRRGQRGQTHAINRRIAELLAAGKDVAIFPEGTTTDGSVVLPFHGALLQPAIDGRHPIRPVSIAYCDADGRRSAAPAYAGDTSFGACLAAILACRSLSVRLRPTPPLAPPGVAAGADRRALAASARSAIAYALGMAAEAPAAADAGGYGGKRGLSEAPPGPAAGALPRPCADTRGRT
jgi:1-acyl-sn-glycerol-3-phosphate acyltransferase